MKAMTKVIIAGLVILIIGVGIMIAGLALNGWSFGKTVYEEKTFVSEQNNDVLDVDLTAGKLNYTYYDGDKIEVTYPTSSRFSYTVSESDGKVTIRPEKKVHFWLWIGDIPDITVKIPQGKVMKFDLDISAGAVNIQSGDFTQFTLDMSAGTLKTGEIYCNDFNCSVSAGTAEFSKITCSYTAIDLSAGTLKILDMECPVLDVDVSAGTVNITLEGARDEYLINTSVSAGSCTVKENGTTVSGAINQSGTDPNKHVSVDVSAGSVNINFVN